MSATAPRHSAPANGNDGTAQPEVELVRGLRPGLCAKAAVEQGRRSLAALAAEIDCLVSLTRCYGTVPEHRRMYGTHASMQKICVLRDECRDEDAAGVDAELRRLKAVARQSPLVARIQDWPQGHPGDFETVEIIARGAPLCGPENPAFWIEWWLLRGVTGAQLRNRLRFQGRETFSGLREGARILSVGCGGALEWRRPRNHPADVRATLVDGDEAALQLAGRRCSWMRGVVTVNENAVSGLEALRGQVFDRIAFGGLFDALDERAVVPCLRMALQLLADDGRIIFTHLAREARPDLLLTGLADWPVLMRSETEIAWTVSEAIAHSGDLSVRQDKTGLAHLCRISRAMRSTAQ